MTRVQRTHTHTHTHTDEQPYLCGNKLRGREVLPDGDDSKKDMEKKKKKGVISIFDIISSKDNM